MRGFTRKTVKNSAIKEAVTEVKTACEFSRELIRKKAPYMSYCGGDYENRERAARGKLTSLFGGC